MAKKFRVTDPSWVYPIGEITVLANTEAEARKFAFVAMTGAQPEEVAGADEILAALVMEPVVGFVLSDGMIGCTTQARVVEPLALRQEVADFAAEQDIGIESVCINPMLPAVNIDSIS